MISRSLSATYKAAEEVGDPTNEYLAARARARIGRRSLVSGLEKTESLGGGEGGSGRGVTRCGGLVFWVLQGC